MTDIKVFDSTPMAPNAIDGNCKIMKKIIIIQNMIPYYRKPVYNELSKHYDVTVLHSGCKSVGIDDLYKEIITHARKIGPFYLQSGTLKEIRGGDYDVVIPMFDIRWLGNILALFLKKDSRFLYWGHRYNKNRLVNKIRDLLMRRADGVILYNDSEICRILSNGLPESKIFVAPNTVYVPNYADGTSYIKDSFLFTGRAQKRKKVDVLIRAFSEVLSQIPETIMINIIGSGAENENLKVLAEKLGVSNRVIFHGEIINDDKLKSFFHRAIAYVSPGPVGLAVLHSFAYGLPVVTQCDERHGPEFENVRDKENALVYNTYDDLKEILVRLCNEKDLSVILGKNAYKLYAKERTLDVMVEGFMDAIEKREEGLIMVKVKKEHKT